MIGDHAAEGRESGFTLVELVVVTLIFAIVTALISVSFNRIVASSGGLIKSVETDIGGMIGLELLRVDLEYAGFGLPWTLPASFTYTEAKNDEHQVADFPATEAASFNDAPGAPPRAYVTLNDGGFNKSDYLVLKGTALGMDDQEVGRKWSYLRYSSVTVAPKPPKSELELTPGMKDRVMVISTGIRNGRPTRELVSDGSTFWFSFDKNEAITDPFRPRSELDRYLVYGLAPPAKNSDDVITFPFNRADYFLACPEKQSAACADGTGVLYRGGVTQKGEFFSFPILDCVADFQVIFRMPTSDGELADQDEIQGEALRALREKLGLDPNVSAAQALREMVKEVQLYILAQQGRIDRSYSYPYGDPSRVIKVGNRYWSETELVTTFGQDWRHYRWKVYTIVVQPKNLN